MRVQGHPAFVLERSIGLQEGRFGVFGEGAYCRSGVDGEAGSAAFGLGATFDLISMGGFTGYALAGANLQNGSPVVYGGVGGRYGLELFPVEGFAEVGVQRLSTDLLAVTGPRVTIGLTYRSFVGPLASLVAPPVPAGDGSGTPAGGVCLLSARCLLKRTGPRLARRPCALPIRPCRQRPVPTRRDSPASRTASTSPMSASVATVPRLRDLSRSIWSVVAAASGPATRILER